MKMLFYVSDTNSLRDTAIKLDKMFNVNRTSLVWAHKSNLNGWNSDILERFRNPTVVAMFFNFASELKHYDQKIQVYHYDNEYSERLVVLDCRYKKILHNELEFFKSLIS